MTMGATSSGKTPRTTMRRASARCGSRGRRKDFCARYLDIRIEMGRRARQSMRATTLGDPYSLPSVSQAKK